MKYRTIIIDDEPLARQRITRLLLPYTDIIEIIAEANDGEEAIRMIEELQPDLLFLDIEMPIYNGLEILKKITAEPIVIFTTAYENYAIKAFENNSIDYLLKPIEKDRLLVSIEKLRRRESVAITRNQLGSIILEEKNAGKILAIPVKMGDRIIMISLNDILYFEASDKYVELYDVHNKKYIIEHSLNQLGLKLPNHFQRIHRSHLVNMNHVKEFRKGFNSAPILVMNDNNETKLHTGRTYIETIKKWMEW